MPLDKESIQERIGKLSQIIKLLDQYKGESEEDFLVDFTINSAAQFNLIIGIEIIVDIGSHILNELYQVRPKEYQEVITALGEQEIISKEFAVENSDMPKFRNFVIHQYEDVDMKQVHAYLQKAPNVFRKFAEYFMDLLEKQA
ncbi:MAG: hypothetical protein G01um101429_391 [Parcubacteria group bacterium Gr01-1014_29]|nr:MAG: hypothetical protein G01um101429_391 [Parcubacteria group bacterium Gr01-1014_29]